jgi:hypothetical protein
VFVNPKAVAVNALLVNKATAVLHIGDLRQPADSHTRQDNHLVRNDLHGLHRLVPAVNKFEGHIGCGHSIQVTRCSEIVPYALDGGGDYLLAVKGGNLPNSPYCAAMRCNSARLRRYSMIGRSPWISFSPNFILLT